VRRAVKITGTLDIECASWDRFAVAATYTQNCKTIHRTIGALVDFVTRKPGATWYAHCGGAYDFLAIAEEFRRREIPCSIDLAGSRISRLVGGGITLRDSWPLVPMTLERAAVIAGERAPDLGLPCTCGRAETPLHAGCGGYCTIRPNDPRDRVADYCAEDCRVLYNVLVAIADEAAALGLTLRGTLGGTAWATAKKTLELPDAEFTPSLWRDVRRAYYGGRVTVARAACKGPGTHWDLSSAYPAALAKTALPIGEASRYAGNDARLCLRNERPGIYAARVSVPAHMFLPPLPLRTGGQTFIGDDGEPERISYPTGSVSGVWPASELLAAVARGCTIDEVLWCVVWSSEAILFDELIAQWFGARARAGKGTPLGEWLRLLANTLTGKFSEQPNRRSARMFPAIKDIKYCTGKRPCSHKRCSGACGQWEQLDMWGKIWSVPFFRPSTAGHIHWAAYLTAACRETWLTGAESQGEHLVYGHTDSLWTTSRIGPKPQGARLGHWELKHEWTDWECAAPGAYRWRDFPEAPEPFSDPAISVEEFHDRARARVNKVAGIAALTDSEFDARAAVRERGVLSFAEAARTADDSRGLFRRKHQRWTMANRGKETGRYGDRLLDASTGLTLPMANG
jgi:hypothetical protein